MLLFCSRRTSTLAALGAAIAIALGGVSPARAQVSDSLRLELQTPWRSSAQWLSIRGGYAKSSEVNSPQAGFGVGVGYTRMLDRWRFWRWTMFKHFSLGGSVHVEQLGTYGRAAEYLIPLTVELDRHFSWTPYMKPYVGIGGGAFYRKLYRTGNDIGQFEPGVFFVAGMNTPLDRSRVLGVDFRYSSVDADGENPNPVFTREEASTRHWGLKLNYSMAY